MICKLSLLICAELFIGIGLKLSIEILLYYMLTISKMFIMRIW